ncbi:anti-sigma factor family protein [Streptomyces sp. NPDC059649]|uniref:anti-sigma factor family protein n=1 Tax=Streptomyces sp. NPDC059649 TaxID=3346895 RepID=UPI0036950F60
MNNDLTCEQLHQTGAELALGVLSGRERAEAAAHLDRCADCREYIEQLALVGDGLLSLVPGSEPPAGFETRVARRLTQAQAARDGRETARAAGLRRAGFRNGVRLRVAAAAAALALGFGFGGWAVGTAIENVAAGPASPVQAGTGMLRAHLIAAGADHRPSVGEIYAHPGPHGWVFMSVDLADAGIRYSGKATCTLERTNGTTVRLGTFHVRDGYAYWGAPASVNPSTLSGARLTSTDGRVLATAHFPPQ